MFLLCLHNVIETEPDAFDQRCSRLSARAFADFLDRARERYELVSFPRLLERLGQPTESGKPWLAFSFDDGFRGVYTQAQPLLAKEGITAALFVNPEHLGNQKLFHFLEIEQAFRLTQRDTFSHPALGEKTFPLGDDAQKVKAMKAVKRAFKLLPELERQREQARLFDTLAVSAEEVSAAIRANENMQVMSGEELRTLQQQGWSIGAHSLSHRTLGKLPPEQQEMEIKGSKAGVEALLGRSIEIFAYPYGEADHIGSFAPAACRSAGFRAAFTTIPGDLAAPALDPYLLPRIDYPEFLRDYL